MGFALSGTGKKNPLGNGCLARMAGKKNPWQQIGGRERLRCQGGLPPPVLWGKKPETKRLRTGEGYWGIGGYRSAAISYDSLYRAGVPGFQLFCSVALLFYRFYPSAQHRRIFSCSASHSGRASTDKRSLADDAPASSGTCVHLAALHANTM